VLEDNSEGHAHWHDDEFNRLNDQLRRRTGKTLDGAW
jgi:hypothetical protein